MPDRPFIPYGRQTIEDDDIEAVRMAVTADYLTTGPTVAALEAAIAEASGAPHCVVVNSGTAALHAAYHALGVGPGDEVIVPPLTFAATANAALYLGASVVFADVDPRTGNLDPGAVADAVTSRTKLVAAVDFAGQPADYEALRAITEPRGIALLADAAHSLGASRGGRPVGSLADVSTFSTHPVKVITTGEGGAVVTASESVDMAARAFRSHGLVRDPEHFVGGHDAPWLMEQQALGYNYRLPDLNCALGLSQMAKLRRFVRRRREIAALYMEAFSGMESLELPHVEPDAEPAWHLFTLRVRDPSRRRAFFDGLRARALGVQVHYPPVYHHPYYRHLGFRAGMCPSAEDYYARTVSIPVYPGLTDSLVRDVVSRVLEASREVL